MRTLKAEFAVEMHNEYGSLGLRPVSMPNADPFGGMAVAHDILEHFPGDTGSVADEFQALGAAIFVRAQPGYFAMKHGNSNASENIAADFPELFRHCLYEGFELKKAPRTTRLEDGDAEQTIFEAVQEGIREMLDQLGDTSSREEKAFVLQSRKDIISWMRIGYRRAARRFKSIRQHEVCDLFRRIEERADKFLKHADEGMRLVVTVNFDKREVYLEEKYPGLDEEY